MDWVTLLDEAGADGVALLSVAELAKLTVTVVGDKLHITGPKMAGVVAQRLITHKHAVMRILESQNQKPDNSAENNAFGYGSSGSDLKIDSWGFPLDPGTVVVGESEIEKRWLGYAAAIRRRLGIDPALQRQPVARGGCPRCHSREYLDVPIHDGRSLRRDCRRCGRMIAFIRWYDTDVSYE